MSDAPPPLVDVDGLTFRYRRATEPAIGFFAVLFAAATIAGFSGLTTHLWTPPLLVELAGG